MSTFELTCMAGNDASVVDVVFVHGLTGHARDTWGGETAGTNIPSDLWPLGLTSHGARVWLAGFPSPLLEFAHGGKLAQAFQEEGEEALKVLESHGLGKKPVIFVAHSLGGLLVKALLCASHDKRTVPALASSIVDVTAAVFFLSTPHAGSDRVRIRHAIPRLVSLALALLTLIAGRFISSDTFPILDAPVLSVGSWVATVHWIVFVAIPALATLMLTVLLQPSRHVELLDPNSSQLRVLRNNFREVLRQRPHTLAPIRVRAMYETLPTSYFGVPLGILVPWSSADPGVTDCIPEPADANHVEICKPPVIERVGLVKQITMEIDAVTTGTKDLVFGDALNALLGWNEIPDGTKANLRALIAAQRFADVKDATARREAEKELRAWLREAISRNHFHPAAWQLHRVVHRRSLELDRYVAAIWWEFHLLDVLRDVRKQAEAELQNWPGPQGEWPSLYAFYRALRTIEHVCTGDLSETRSSREGTSDRELLLKLLTDAYKRLEDAQQTGRPSPDSDGSTRDLLLRMECAVQAMSAAWSFVRPPARPEDREREVERAMRNARREQFRQAWQTFKSALDRPHGQQPGTPSR